MVITMAIAGMKHLFLAGMTQERMDILDVLMDAGVVQLDEFQPEEQELAELVQRYQPTDELNGLDIDIYKVRSALTSLERYHHAKKPLFAKRRVVSRDSYRAAADERSTAMAAADAIDRSEQRMAEITAEKNHIDHKIEQLAHYRSLDIPLNCTGTQYTQLTYGFMPLQLDSGALLNELENAGAYGWEIASDEANRYIGVLCHVNDRQAVRPLLEHSAFEEASLPTVHGTAAENIRALEQQKTALNEEYAAAELAIQEQLKTRELLETYYDYLNEQRDKLQMISRFVSTQTVFFAKGWVLADRADALLHRLETQFDSILIELTEPEPEENHPILLENNRLVQPFELVTELYSLPKATELDPNPSMSIFYFIFFGLMLSDAGYGIVLSLLTGFVVWRYKPEGVMGKLMRLMCICGVSTTFWGVLFGGWFGDAFGIQPVWFSPLEDPMTLLIWSFGFGLVHLFVGMGMNAYQLIKRGKWLDAVFDIGFWYALIGGLVLFLVNAKVGMIVAGIGAVGLILTQGRHKKNIFQKLFSGVASLYNITSYLSDVLSYSRLLALGLATGVIANVVNTMCRLGLGGNVFVLLLVGVGFVVGHVFNLAINTLGAYVHASRLQYVEYFGKFYEGGGEAFKPLKRKTKYIDVQ